MVEAQRRLILGRSLWMGPSNWHLSIPLQADMARAVGRESPADFLVEKNLVAAAFIHFLPDFCRMSPAWLYLRLGGPWFLPAMPCYSRPLESSGVDVRLQSGTSEMHQDGSLSLNFIFNASIHARASTCCFQALGAAARSPPNPPRPRHLNALCYCWC